ncbi:hypothetical protein MPTK1_5g12020 [Marchantia polymorpha subsp. ruderalis]|uniref:Uncharacterized protein n=2 Tax=Marchantia polymorpha TaxID=3197 RepID=A0AAF6BHH0_MARPO|nr:hypothetical protein MARPO_0143s0031 [Marchantia polymorpha]BBN11454.1 hypothetical protein Mp_5g12020 [Marchantia polymorpha subsp. ruderalis]|eukprot:PTQ29353.1 hypothetical protein MARPO_0143s0031 [Marchantia polymorpha]
MTPVPIQLRTWQIAIQRRADAYVLVRCGRSSGASGTINLFERSRFYLPGTLRRRQGDLVRVVCPQRTRSHGESKMNWRMSRSFFEAGRFFIHDVIFVDPSIVTRQNEPPVRFFHRTPLLTYVKCDPIDDTLLDAGHDGFHCLSENPDRLFLIIKGKRQYVLFNQ